MRKKVLYFLGLLLLLNLSCKGKQTEKVAGTDIKETKETTESISVEKKQESVVPEAAIKQYPVVKLPPGERAIATINGQPILESDFNAKFESIIGKENIEKIKKEDPKRLLEAKEQYLDSLISELLLKEELKSRKITVSVEELDKAMMEVAARNVPFPGINSEAELREALRLQISAQKLMEKEVLNDIEKPTEKEIEKFYAENKEDIHKMLREQIYTKNVEKFQAKWLQRLRDRASIKKKDISELLSK